MDPALHRGLSLLGFVALLAGAGRLLLQVAVRLAHITSMRPGILFPPSAIRATLRRLAAPRITTDLVAIWFVQGGPDETATDQARRKGQALAALLAFGLAAVEDSRPDHRRLRHPSPGRGALHRQKRKALALLTLKAGLNKSLTKHPTH